MSDLCLNIGCGEYRLHGFVNIDGDPNLGPDVVCEAPPLEYDDASISEIYAGHFFEHLDRVQAADFLDECWRVLMPGGRLGLVVPDTRECMRRYVNDEPAPAEFPAGTRRDLRDLDELCDMIIFSTAQPSHHQWAYDLHSLGRALERAGFEVTGEIDRFSDPRLSTPQWYQAGLDARKP